MCLKNHPGFEQLGPKNYKCKSKNCGVQVQATKLNGTKNYIGSSAQFEQHGATNVKSLKIEVFHIGAAVQFEQLQYNKYKTKKFPVAVGGGAHQSEHQV